MCCRPGIDPNLWSHFGCCAFQPVIDNINFDTNLKIKYYFCGLVDRVI